MWIMVQIGADFCVDYIILKSADNNLLLIILKSADYNPLIIVH